MKRLFVYFIILVLTLSVTVPAQAITEAKSQAKIESLSYDVYFHLGFIWAKAGRGELSLHKETEFDGTERIHGRLAAKSLSVVENIMKVRDTLDTWMNPNYVPREFIKKTHEGKYNAIEHNLYQSVWKDKNAALTPANVKSTTVKVHRWRKKGNDKPTDRDTIHTVSEPAYDMLSTFFALRKLDFDQMKKGDVRKFASFAGLKKDWIKVQYGGIEKVKLRNGKQYESHYVLLTFSTKDQDSTPLKAWLSTTEDHKPLKVIIGLSRIGSVQCEISQ